MKKDPDCILEFMANGTPVAHISATITDKAIDNLIRMTLPLVMDKDIYWVCAIAGYEDDERELYEVPEVRDFCRRLVEHGFIASLRLSTMYQSDDKRPELKRFLGGMEVWAFAENLLEKNGDFRLTKERFERFDVVLKKAEKRAVSLVRSEGPIGPNFSNN